jgi:Lhr-like helicase
VQDDIAQQLGLVRSARFIHGFRRANIAIEVVEAAPSQRPALAYQLLLDGERRPGIVYTPTRKQAESMAAELAAHFSTAAYHAGLDAEHRKRVQEEFLAGKVDVMVATIAFGMGIDKPDVRTVIHTALPGSLEAYYQEIERILHDSDFRKMKCSQDSHDFDRTFDAEASPSCAHSTSFEDSVPGRPERFSGLDVHAAQQIGEARVRAQRIELYNLL